MRCSVVGMKDEGCECVCARVRVCLLGGENVSTITFTVLLIFVLKVALSLCLFGMALVMWLSLMPVVVVRMILVVEVVVM